VKKLLINNNVKNDCGQCLALISYCLQLSPLDFSTLMKYRQTCFFLKKRKASHQLLFASFILDAVLYLITVQRNQGKNSLNKFIVVHVQARKINEALYQKCVNATQLKIFIRKLHHIIELILFTNKTAT